MPAIPKNQIENIYHLPLLTLIDRARAIHQQNFKDDIELCQLISVKTGGCPEDCGYCSQSIHHQSKITLNPLLPLTQVTDQVAQAKLQGVKRICLGGAYKTPPKSALKKMAEYIEVIKAAGLESCATLGSLNPEQAQELKQAGLDYYNHNLDTSPEYYAQVVSTRKYSDRLETIRNVAAAGIKVCCGGILGLGEATADRISFIQALSNLPKAPESIPINTLVKMPGTKLAAAPELDKMELVRVIATIRCLFPSSRIRLSAGRKELSNLEQALCFLAGANSIWYGEKLLTAANNQQTADQELLKQLAGTIHA